LCAEGDSLCDNVVLRAMLKGDQRSILEKKHLNYSMLIINIDVTSI